MSAVADERSAEDVSVARAERSDLRKRWSAFLTPYNEYYQALTATMTNGMVRRLHT